METDVFTLDVTFDELAGQVMENPDDELAIQSLKGFVAQAYEAGAIQDVMQMAMTIGAMACMGGHEHNAMAGVANEMSLLYGPAFQEMSQIEEAFHRHSHEDDDEDDEDDE